MTFSLIKLVVFVAVATARRLLPQNTHTVKVYTNSAPVLFSVDQNQFLSLPQIPSLVHRGSEKLNLVVPLPTEEVSKQVLLSNYLGFDLVSEGFLYSSPNEIQPLTLNASSVVEITGLFQPPRDGYYNMTLADWVIAAVQIGPGMRQKYQSYTITDQWHILDNRLADKGTFLLEKHLFYPFRIVILGDKTPLEWDLTTHDPDGQPVDLLGLWAQPA
ncbi:hypothetical protein OXX69_007502 [Metschnikowia pulcherrima]